MSTTIDSKVVEMRFDNKDFEKNAETSMSTLDKLKKSLRMKGATDGLEDVDSAVKKISFAGLTNAVDTVGLKFNAMYTIADQALRNITNSAINTGTRLVKSLSIDQVTAGWSKYGQKTASVQTIMNATGKSIDEVNKYLDKLMWFSDETSYGFTDMTSALGQLTSAGGDIDKLIPMITGIANATAYAGKSSSEFSRAIYNLNQSYSAGNLQYMDWKSLELAGIASKELKQTFIDTGIALGKISEGEVTIANFGQTLSKKWADTEVMEAAFGKFGEMTEKAYEMVQNGEVDTASEAYAILAEQYDGVAITAAKAAQEAKTFEEAIEATKDAVSSGWMKTFELIFGNYEEAKTLWTDLANALWDAFASGADARNEMLSEWKDLGGRDDLIESFWNLWDAIASVITPIKEAFRDIFPATTAKQLFEITENIKNFTTKLKLSEETSDKLKRTFKGLFAILDIGKQLLSAVFKAITPLFGGVGDLGGGILGLTAKFGDWLVKLDESIKSSGVFVKVAEGIAKTIKVVTKAVKTAVNAFKEKILTPGWEVFHSFLEALHKRIASVREAMISLKDSIVSSFNSTGSSLAGNGLYKLMQSLWKGITTIATAIGKAFGSLAKGLMNLFSGDGFGGFIDNLNALISGGIGIAIIKFFKSITNTIESFGDITKGIVNIFDGLGDCLAAYQNKIKANTLMTIAKAIAILAASLIILALIDSDKLLGAISVLTMLFAELMTSMAVFTKIAGKIKGVGSSVTAMVGLSVAVLILAGALKTIANLEFDELVTGLLGVAGLMAIVVATMKALRTDDKKVIKGATQIVLLATAIKILASACNDLAYLSWSELAKGLVGVGVLLAEVSLFMNTAKFSNKSVTTATGILILSGAIKILASACDDFGHMDWSDIGKGLTAIGGLLTEIALFTNLTGNAKHVVSTGVALIAIAAAMKIFVSAAKDIAKMSWAELAKGLTTLGLSLAAITIALRLMPKNMLSMGTGLIAVSTAILIMTSALNKLGGMSWESIAKGMVSLGGSILILAVGLNAMKGTLGASAALLVAVAALTVLVPVLSILGAMSWGSIVKGLVSIAGAFAIIGVAAYALKPVLPAVLGLAGALALIGVAVLAFGAGVAALGVGLTALATGFTAIVASLSAIVTGIVGLVSAVIVGILKGIGEGIVAFCQVIIDGIPAIAEAIKVVVLSVCDVLIECVPKIAETLLALVVALLKSLSEYAPTIIDYLFDFLIGLLDRLADRLPELIQAGVRVIKSFFEGVLGALSDELGTFSIIDTLGAVGLMAGVMAALSAVSALIPSAMIGVLGMGAVVAELAIVLAAIGALAQIPGLSWLIEEGADLLKNIGNAIGGLIGGIVGGIAEGVTSALPQIGSDLSGFMSAAQPFIEGARQIDSSVMDGVKTLVGVILALTGVNIFDKLTSWLTGGSSLVDFGEELAAFGPCMKQYADSVAGIDASAIQASANAAKALAEMTSTIPNSGGVAAWFAGENSISQFGNELIFLGQGLKGFSDAIVGVNPEAIIAASNAAKALAEMTSTIPNSGGVVSWFAGENSISKFGDELISLGAGLKGFAMATMGIDPEAITATANAAKALVDMTNYIPNEGGIVAWFAGDNSISKFGNDIVNLGMGLKGFATATMGIDPEAITAAANAAKALAEMTNYIPNEGGIIAWLTGETSISKFSTDLVTLGQGLKGFAMATIGIDPEGVTASANAAKALAEMTSYIPNSGGVVSWFTGENSISKFASELVSLGMGLKGFATATAGIASDGLTAAANAAKSIAEMTTYIPTEGGIKAWFTGETSIANFATQLPILGAGLKGFSASIEGINPDNITAAANAAKALAEMTAVIPTEGGIKAWFTGKTSIANFADKLPTLGEGLKGFSESVAGINPESTTAAASAAKSLGEMTSVIPKNTDKLGDFGDNLINFGEDLKSYFDNTKGITTESISATTNAIDAIKKVSTLDSGNIKSTAKAIDDMADTLNNLSKIPKDSTSKFTKAMQELGETSADGLVDALNDIKSETKKAGENAMSSFADGIKAAISKAEAACKKVIDACVEALSSKRSSFGTAGKYVALGFADGISANSYKAEAKARAMAKAAAKAAEEALGIESPSKVFYGVGNYAGLGFVNALDDYADIAYNSGSSMAESARSGLSKAIGKIKDIISGNVDVQPTIRPVLDLSDVRSEARNISTLLGAGTSVGVMANVGAISSMMNRRNQNGGNDDIVSAIDKLRKDMKDTENGSTYNINGITYDDGSNIADAVRSIVRAVKVDRRT